MQFLQFQFGSGTLNIYRFVRLCFLSIDLGMQINRANIWNRSNFGEVLITHIYLKNIDKNCPICLSIQINLEDFQKTL